MSNRYLWLFSPLNFAAYLTSAAVAVGLLAGSRGSLVETTLGSVLMGVFLAGFVLEAWWRTRSSQRHVNLAVLAIEAAAALTLVALTGNGIAAVLLIIVVAQAAVLPLRWLIALAAAANFCLLAILLRLWPLQSALIMFVMYLGFQAFAGLTSYYAKDAARSRDALVQVNAHLLATRSLLEETARDGERLRLSRELHDVAGHKLTALKLQLALLARDPTGTTPVVTIATGLVGELLNDLRGVVGQLRHHDGLDLKRAIEQLAAPFPKPKVHIEIMPEARVDDVVQAQALLRAAQEALTNAARHSSANNVWLTLVRTPTRIVLSVRDDGRGAEKMQLGHGLTGMRERLAALGGGVDLTGTQGFRIDAWVPVERVSGGAR